MIDAIYFVAQSFVGMSMIFIGAFGLGWYLRKPPVYGRVVGVAGRRCNDG